MNPQKLFILPIVLLLLLSCAVHKRAFKHGETAAKNKDWDRAVRYLLRAVEKKPDNVEYRISLSRALITASNIHLARGSNFLQDGELKLALLEFDKSLEYNPENNEARNQKRLALKKAGEIDKKYREKTEIEIIKEKAQKELPTDAAAELSAKTFDFKVVNQHHRNIFKALGSVSGVDFLFDESFKEKKMSIDLEQTNLFRVIEAINIQSKLFYKILDEKTIIIVPDTPAKRREYDEQVMKTFFLSSAEPEEMRKIIGDILGTKTISFNKELNSLTIAALPGEIKLIEKIVQTHDKPKGEVDIEIEVIEVNKKAIQEYGIELSQYYVGEYYSPGALADSTTSVIRLNALKHTDASDFLLTLPSLNYQLLKFNSRSKIKARPRLRVMDKETIKVSLGDKVPIPTTTFVPQYGSNTPNQQPITSYQMTEIGIIIEISPRIHHDGLVSLKTKFELTFITDPGTPTLPPTIGNRSVNTILRLRDNETSIMAGLLRDTERKTLQGLPFISSLPVLKQIFSGNRKEVEQTDIVITITPRIVRFPGISQDDLDYFWVGTKERPELKETPPFEFRKEKEKEKEEKEEEKEAKEEIDAAAQQPGKEIKPAITAPPNKPVEQAKAEQSGQTSGQEKIDRSEKTGETEKIAPAENSGEKKEELKTTEPGDSKPTGEAIFSFAVPGSIKAGGEFPAVLSLSGARPAGIIKIDIEFDATLLQVIDIEQGERLGEAEIKSHFFKTFDNGQGKIRLNLTMENPPPGDVLELAVFHLKAKVAGRSELRAASFEIMDTRLKKLAGVFSPCAIEVEK